MNGPATPSRQASWHTLFPIWAIAILLMALTGLFVSHSIDDARARAYENAQHDLSNLTRVTQEHANRTLRGADQVIRFMTARYLEIGDKLDLVQLTRAGVIDEEIFTQVAIADKQGMFAIGSRPVLPRPDLSDREHFKVHVASDSVGLFVSKPVLGRTSHRWSLQLTRRITGPHGEFDGVAVVSIDPGYFTRFYRELKLGSQGVIALYGLDGVSRARTVSGKEEFGSNASNAPMFARIAQGEENGSYTYRSVIDNVNRMYYFRRVPGYDLVVTAGVNIADLESGIALESKAILLQAALVCALILVLAYGLSRYLIKLGRAVDARVLAQNQVQDRTEQLNTIFALSPDGFVSFDQHRRVKYVNPAFSQMTGLNELRLEGMDEMDFSAWLAARCTAATRFCGMAQLREHLNNSAQPALQLLELGNPGKTVLQVTLRQSDTQTVSQILYFRDVTRETEVDEMKSEFLTTAAHELRTPMASILGFSELLLDHTDPLTQQEFLSIIHTQSKAMAVILDELLDLARIEARRDKDFEFASLDLQNLCTDILAALPIPHGRAAPTVSMPAEPLVLLADGGKLRQAMVNVLTNAYKYSPKGGPVGFTVAPLLRAAEAPQIHIQIRDQGIGMTAEQASRVFERFYRADKSGNIPGSGLGMSLVQEIIKLHHGSVEIESVYQHGTCVHIYLPLQNP